MGVNILVKENICSKTTYEEAGTMGKSLLFKKVKGSCFREID